MKNLLFVIILLGSLSCVFKNEGRSKQKNTASNFQKEKIELHFDILKDSVRYFNSWEKEYEDFYAKLIRTNKSNRPLKVSKILHYGHKGDGKENYIEAMYLNGKKISINNSADYTWLTYDFFSQEDSFTELKINESQMDTISMTSLYEFKEKGNFKLRFVYYFSEDTIYSNWDTLKIY